MDPQGTSPEKTRTYAVPPQAREKWSLGSQMSFCLSDLDGRRGLRAHPLAPLAPSPEGALPTQNNLLCLLAGQDTERKRRSSWRRARSLHFVEGAATGTFGGPIQSLADLLTGSGLAPRADDRIEDARPEASFSLLAASPRQRSPRLPGRAAPRAPQSMCPATAAAAQATSSRSQRFV